MRSAPYDDIGWTGRQPHEAGAEWSTGACLIWAVSFNFVLCFVDTNIAALSPAAVILAEIMTVGWALTLIALRWNRACWPWLGLLFALLVNWLVLSLLNQLADPKLIRDVLLIPVFIMLGLVSNQRELYRVVWTLQILIFVVMCFELIGTTSFARVFNVQSFYVHTRGFEESSFWNKSSDLFVSATRPGERNLPFFGAHRLSSIFLEPVSLGNWVILLTIYVAGFGSALPSSRRKLLAASSLILLLACDGRLAFGLCLIVLAIAAFRNRLSPALAVVAPVVALLLGAMLAAVSNEQAGQDNLGGRVGLTLQLAARLDVADLLGLSQQMAYSSMDSGLVYLILSQGLFGVLCVWLFVFWPRTTGAGPAFLVLGVAVYISGTWLVSYSILSIKTAALLWHMFGVAISADERQEARVRGLDARLVELPG